MIKYDKHKIADINKIQLSIFKETIRICEEMSLSYFLVHGTLLGAIKYNGFVPYDDDIDIAMPRKDYDVFIKSANKIIKNDFFVQSYQSEKKYPLAFSKVRHNNTAYISNMTRHLNINQGIYIDVFPIDNVADGFKGKIHTVLDKFFSFRISRLFNNKDRPFRKKILLFFSCILLPSVRLTIKLRENNNRILNKTSFISITGGKKSEKRIPSKWFENKKSQFFCDVECDIPHMFVDYLNQIYYGDFNSADLLEHRFHDENFVEMNADLIDTDQSYLLYLNGKK